MDSADNLLARLQLYQETTNSTICEKDKKITELEGAIAKLVEILEKNGITKVCPKGDPMVGVI